jgi:hypothetical protein
MHVEQSFLFVRALPYYGTEALSDKISYGGKYYDAFD